MAAQIPLTPVVNKGLSYLNGLQMTWTDTDTLTIAQGQCRNSTNVNDIVLARPPLNNGTAVTTGFTISTAVVGAGGLDVGTMANNTHYAVYVISSSENSWINLPPSEQQSLAVPPFTTPSPTSAVVQGAYYVQANVVISTSFTAPTLPAGFDQFRRIGAVLTDGSANFLPFDQRGNGVDRTVIYRTSIATDITAGTSTAFAAVSVAASIPVASGTGIFAIAFTPTGADDQLDLRCGDSATDAAQATLSGDAAGVVTRGNLVCPIGATLASGVDYKITAAGSVAINVQGYVDEL
ncbi:MAG: hypothetical protein KIH63_004780 [Candidatus Saccharibacteria bacterium]|nr:hypothetical protein [Candidatus Saccharibacteria bacterium]